MSSDEEFGRRLGANLHDELAGIEAPAGLVTTLRRRQARRDWAVRGALAAPVAAVAVATVVLTNSAGTAPSSPVAGPSVPTAGSGSPSTTIDLTNVAHVREQTVQALTRASELIAHIDASIDGHRFQEAWQDPTTGAYRNDVYQGPNGELDQSHAVRPAGPGHQMIMTLDHPSRTWSEDRIPVEERDGRFPDDDPASLRDAVAKGRLMIVGRETVNGHETLRLALKLDDSTGRLTYQIWVDQETFMPYRVGVAKDARETPNEIHDYTWLPRTPENLAHLQLRPPPGFKPAPQGGQPSTDQRATAPSLPAGPTPAG